MFEFVKSIPRHKHLIGLVILLATFSIGYLCSYLTAESTLNSSDYHVPVIADTVTDSAFETAPLSLNNSQENGFDGWYVLEDVNGVQKSEMFHISVEFADVDSNIPKKMTGDAGVFSPFEEIGDQGYVEDSWAAINAIEAKFETKAINGFVYSFRGTFFKGRAIGENGEKLLRGTFKTFKKGKLIRKATGDFTYYQPQCWH